MNHIPADLIGEIDWRINVFESLSFPTLVLTPDKAIISANRVFLKTYNYEASDIIGRKCYEIFGSIAGVCVFEECPLQRVLVQRRGCSILKRIKNDKRFRNDKRESKWEDRVFSPILDNAGEVAYIIESIRDVTRMKFLEQELAGTREFFKRVFESSPSAIVAADRNGKVIFMNRAAGELFGYHIDNLSIVNNVKNLYPPGKAHQIMQKLRDKTTGGLGKLPGSQTTILNAAGEEIPVELTAAIIYDNDGREVATMGIYNDLREKLSVEKQLKETQAQLAQSEKMASLGQLAAGVAHEINNPLTGILFYTGLSIERLSSNEKIYEYLNYVVEDVNRCKEIVKNLLAYSRQSGSIKNIIQVNELIDKSLNLMRDQKIFANITMERNLSDDMMLIHVDTNQMTQVMINLVMNAVDAMDREGTLTLRTWRNKQLQKAYISIADTGSGIPVEHLSKIFDPFFTTKEPGKGTGLGLSTAYGIVSENGGTISVETTSNLGTTFVIDLPLYIPAGEENVISP